MVAAVDGGSVQEAAPSQKEVLWDTGWSLVPLSGVPASCVLIPATPPPGVSVGGSVVKTQKGIEQEGCSKCTPDSAWSSGAVARSCQ